MVARRVKSPWTEPPQLVPYGSAEVAVRAPARPAGTHASPAPDPGDFAVEAFAQGHGRIEEAHAALKKAIAIAPTSFDFYVRQRAPWHRPEDYAHTLEGLRKAGLPER